jgi:hypothetical protein
LRITERIQKNESFGGSFLRGKIAKRINFVDFSGNETRKVHTTHIEKS